MRRASVYLTNGLPALRKIASACLLACICLSTIAQQFEDSLIRSCNSAVNDDERIERMGRLSDYYYANKQFASGDSLIEKQIMLAEASLDRQKVLNVLFGNAGYRVMSKTTKDGSQNTRAYILRALEYAKANKLTEYIALAQSSMAALNDIEGDLDKALKNASQGFTTALNTENDSIKVICAIQLGWIYLQRSDVLTTFKTYTNANNIAVNREDKSLLPLVFHAMAGLYKKLGKDEDAKTYLYRSLAINKNNRNFSGQIEDHIFLAKVSNYAAAKDHLRQAIQLADSLHNAPQKIVAEKILFSYMLLEEKPSYTLAYLQADPLLRQVYSNTGPNYLDWIMAEIYLYGGQPDSAAVYFKKAEPAISAGYDLPSRRDFFGEFASCLEQLKDVSAAINYYKKSLELASATYDLPNLQYFSGRLRDLYKQSNDFKEAFSYSVLHDNYKDSVDVLGRERDLALLEIDNEAKQQQRDKELALRQLERKYDLQYMLITIVVATAFVLMLMIGMFKVSTFTIRLMSFLALIFFFEFVILILEKWIHEITHGEPWKNWLIKIGIISILLPIHHMLEHRLIRYLLSRHLIKVRSRLSPLNLFKRQKKQLPPEAPEKETTGSAEKMV